MERKMGGKAWMRRAAAGMLAVSAVAVLPQLAGCGGPDAKSMIASARTALAKKEIEPARISLKSALQKDPNNAEARALLGQLLLDTGDAAGAEVELRRALELQHPQAQVLPALANAMLVQNKAPLLLQQFGTVQLNEPAAQAQLQTSLAAAEATGGNVEAADRRLDALLQAQPAYGPALLLRARLVANRGDTAGALAQVEAMLAKQPDDAEAWQFKGDLLMRAKPGEKPPIDKATAAYEEAIKRRPDAVGAHSALVMLALQSGSATEAAKRWEPMSKVAPRHPQTMFLDAVLSEQRGDLKHAREVTQELLRVTPGNPQLLILAGQVEARLNGLAQAETYFGKAVQLLPNAPQPRLQLAQLQLKGGQADKALGTLAPLLDGANASVEALSLAAQAHVMKGDREGAEAAFARAAKLKPDDSRVRMALAMADVAKGKTSAGVGELRKMAAADKSTTPDMALVDVLIRTNDLPGAMKAIDGLAVKLPNEALPDQLRGRIALLQRDLPAARKHFEASLAKNPDYLPALAGLATVDVNEKKPDAAKARFEGALQRNPKNAGAMLALAELTSNTGGKSEDVIALLKRAVAADPRDPTPQMMLLDQLLAAGQYKAAQDAAQAGLTALPDNTELLDRLGRAQLLAGDPQQALATFGKLANLAPRSAQAQLRIADAQNAARNPGAAGVAVRRAAELSPDNQQVQVAQVLVALQEERFEQALAVARKVQAKRPDDALGYNLEGDIEMRRKNWDAAITVLRKAVTRNQPVDAAQRLHSSLVAAKKTAEAEAHATDWRKKHPNDMGFVLYLGDSAMATGDKAGAEANYRAVLATQPDNMLALNNLAYLLAVDKKPGAVELAEKALQRAPRTAAVLDTLAFALAAENKLPRALEVQRQAVAAAPDQPNFKLQLARLLLQTGDKAGARSELSALAALGNKFPRQSEVAELIKTADR